ncbi:MAG: hypothetical protein EAX81_03780 [Candidatus Thorarchaeota archaeon]|nr:hypothetical protein [Candidatus Thorarchaeota archaeon]
MIQIGLVGRFKLLCIISILLVISLGILLDIDEILRTWRNLPLLLLFAMCFIITLPNEEDRFLKQSVLPIVFLSIACTIPYSYHYNPAPIVYEPPAYPPPGYSTQWWYFPIGDFDYFFRLRFLPISLPFWIIIGIILLQMNMLSHPQRYVDFLMHLAIGCMLSIFWWFLAIWVFSDETTWVNVPIATTPLLGIVFVAVHRALNWKSREPMEESKTN